MNMWISYLGMLQRISLINAFNQQEQNAFACKMQKYFDEQDAVTQRIAVDRPYQRVLRY